MADGYTIIPAAPGTYGPGGLVIAYEIEEGRYAGASGVFPVYAPEGVQIDAVAAFKADKPADTDYPSLDILRTDKAFKKLSYWRFSDFPHDFIFQIEPGEPVPNDNRVQRVTRDQFALLKKEMTVVELAALWPDEETPEPRPAPTTVRVKPTAPPAPVEDDDDDLI